MFFSLKCGSLFNPLLDEKEVTQDLQRLIILLQAIKNASGDGTETEKANSILDKYQIRDRISLKDFNDKILQKAEYKHTYLHQLSVEREKEENDKIFRVLSTHPGIELVHFCTNDKMKETWRNYNLGHTMGEVLFWKFIVPKFFAVQKLIGCEYAFLFAADLSEDGTLVNYYDVTLKFKKRLDVGTNKPFYDFCCDFMCQKINYMREYQKYFFDHFNIDENDELI